MTEHGETIREALSLAVKELAGAGVPEPLAEAEYLLTHILGCTRPGLYMDAGRVLESNEASAFDAFVGRRKKREPAQYITGEVEFRGHTLKVTRATLIPRPETELLVDRVVEEFDGGRAAKDAVIVDLCTGSGCIAVSIAKEVAGCRVYATDISKAALDAAKGNAAINGVAERVEFFEGDLFSSLPARLKGKADIVVANPPYVSETEMQGLAPEVRDFEPKTALLGGADGLVFIRRIISGAPEYLKSGGLLLIEIGYSQSGRVGKIAEADGRYSKPSTGKDYSGIERIFSARLK